MGDGLRWLLQLEWRQPPPSQWRSVADTTWAKLGVRVLPRVRMGNGTW